MRLVAPHSAWAAPASGNCNGVSRGRSSSVMTTNLPGFAGLARGKRKIITPSRFSDQTRRTVKHGGYMGCRIRVVSHRRQSSR